MSTLLYTCISFFFNDTATTEIYTLSLHDALPICVAGLAFLGGELDPVHAAVALVDHVDVVGKAIGELHAVGRIRPGDRKSTRLNSSHQIISYAVFCLKKKKITISMQSQKTTLTTL